MSVKDGCTCGGTAACPQCQARDAAPGNEAGCDCPPCAGRGNDGHRMTHCAECCFGSGVEADIDCPTHGARPPMTSHPAANDRRNTMSETYHGIPEVRVFTPAQLAVHDAVVRGQAMKPVSSAREAIREEMLRQPITAGRDTYSDGYGQGLCRALDHLDPALRAALGFIPPPPA